MEYEGVELRAYLDVIRRWLWLIALGAFLAGAAALTVSFLIPPTYQAEAAVVEGRRPVRSCVVEAGAWRGI